MNFWHIQLHPNNLSWGKERQVLERTGYIGMGDWDDDQRQQFDFEHTVAVNDIAIVKRGRQPIALVEVVGDYEYTLDTDEDLDWFRRRRKVKVLDWYKDEYNFDVAARGTLTKCNMNNKNAETNKSIKRWYEKVMNEQQLNEVIDLLKYKHQIILQGPPGTGKTRLAKLVAEKLIEPENKGTPEVIIDNLIRNFDTESVEVQKQREEYLDLLSSFQNTFPKENLKNLTLDEYCIGTGENNSFCWWIERGLQSLGYYFPGSSHSYKVYWSKSNNHYSKHGFVESIEDDKKAMKMIAEALHNLVNHQEFEQAFERFNNSFVLKILHSYYPDEYFPINSEKSINNALKLFKSYDDSLSLLEKNKKLIQIYLEKKENLNSKITQNEFANLIWDNFDLKEGKDLTQSNEIKARGRYEIIQFHPAYTYEDFVRGIVANSENGNISYDVENKKLAQIAQEACENPNANYVLIIDEINRANLPSVLGELIYALEYRGESVQTMYEYNETQDIKLPKNLYIIGTMNTADRSIGHIDYAIRRRFAFYDVLPDESVITDEKAKMLFNQVAHLFKDNKYLSSDFDANDVQIGHSYFLPSKKGLSGTERDQELKQKLKYEIKPILNEYIKDGILLESAGEEIQKLNV